MAPNNTEQTFNDSSLSNDNSDNNINIATIPQSQLDDQYQAPNKKKTSISFHSSANGSVGLDVSDTSRLSSSARTKTKRRSSIFTGRRPSRRRLKHNSSPEDRHAALDDEEGMFMFIYYCLCVEVGKEGYKGGYGVIRGLLQLCAHHMLKLLTHII